MTTTSMLWWRSGSGCSSKDFAVLTLYVWHLPGQSCLEAGASLVAARWFASTTHKPELHEDHDMQLVYSKAKHFVRKAAAVQ